MRIIGFAAREAAKGDAEMNRLQQKQIAGQTFSILEANRQISAFIGAKKIESFECWSAATQWFASRKPCSCGGILTFDASVERYAPTLTLSRGYITAESVVELRAQGRGAWTCNACERCE
jgi:hypothetical protein